jgi:hypothetical protein
MKFVDWSMFSSVGPSLAAGKIASNLVISANVRKKFETALIVFSGAWGKLIHEKNRSRKSRDTAPLRSLKRVIKSIFIINR